MLILTAVSISNLKNAHVPPDHLEDLDIDGKAWAGLI